MPVAQWFLLSCHVRWGHGDPEGVPECSPGQWSCTFPEAIHVEPRLKMILKPYWKISVLKKNLTGIELLFSEQEERVPILFLQWHQTHFDFLIGWPVKMEPSKGSAGLVVVHLFCFPLPSISRIIVKPATTLVNTCQWSPDFMSLLNNQLQREKYF